VILPSGVVARFRVRLRRFSVILFILFIDVDDRSG
jgi:hypothetical protein